MRKIITVLVLLMIFVWGGGYATTASGNLVQQLSHYQTFKAHFSQQTLSLKKQIVATSSGRFYIKRPDKFRWETLQPNNQVIIGNSHYTWVYDVDLMQATKRAVSDKSWSPAELIMGDSNTLNKFFTVTEKTQGQVATYTLQAKQPDQIFRKVQFVFKNDGLSTLIVTNNLNQTATFRFSRAKYNVKLSNKLFQFKPKPGVDVINAQQ